MEQLAVVQQTHLGLHFTPEEVTIWRKRTTSGPYKSKNDAQANSPGDWDRIFTNAKAFLANPTADRYSKTVWKGMGCIPNLNSAGYNASQDPATLGDNLRDAGFYYLLTGDIKYAAAVRAELLAEASNPLLDFTNTSRWCPKGMGDLNPGFIVAEWLTRLLYGYDYIKATLNAADNSKLNGWFLGAANYMRGNYDPNMDSLFVKRSEGNYTLTPYAQSKERTTGVLMYFGGTKSRFVGRQYNNRRASMATYVGLSGIFFGEAALKASGKRFFKELVMFSIYPVGYYSDFLRGTEASPEKGYTYSTLGTLYVLADALARNGDTELYDWTTKEGTLGVDGSSDGRTAKGLKMNIKAMLDLRNHVTAAYATTKASSVGIEKFRIDGITPGGNYSVWDIMYCLPNIYYKDEYVRNSYLRKAAGAIPYPVKAQTSGARPPWSIGDFPGILFMFGQMEGKVWPYAPLPKKDQRITFDPLPEKTEGDDPYPLVANSDSDLLVVFASSNSSVVAIFGSMAQVVGEGTAEITASQAGNDEYNAAKPITQTQLVNKRIPTTEVVSFTVVNADTGTDMFVMGDSNVLFINTLETKNLNIRANVGEIAAERVEFALSGKQTRISTERGLPYALWGDRGGNHYNAWVPDLGSYILRCMPYVDGKAGKALTVTFTIR